jgi:hypothetical protein
MLIGEAGQERERIFHLGGGWQISVRAGRCSLFEMLRNLDDQVGRTAAHPAAGIVVRTAGNGPEFTAAVHGHDICVPSIIVH